MQRVVVITMVIDPTEYHGAEDTAKGAVELACDMLTGNADLPNNRISVACDNWKTSRLDNDVDPQDPAFPEPAKL